MRYVILGNSAAGLAAAEAIRRRDPRGEVVIVSEEPHPPYCRVLTSNLLAGDVDEEGILFRDPEIYDRLDLQPLLGERAEEVDTARCEVRLSGGRKVRYDRLLVATGSSPKRIGAPGDDLPGVGGLRTLDDARGFLARAEPGKTALVIGGGLVSCKAAEALVKRGMRVIVAVTSPQLLSQMLPSDEASPVMDGAHTAGVEVRTGRSVAEVLGSPGTGVSEVILDDGERFPCRCVVVGKGVTPNIDMLGSSGVKVDWGVIVNERMETSVPGIFAAGDVAEAPDALTGGLSTNAMWPNALSQGTVAGENMAAGRAVHPGGLSINTGTFFGVPAVSVGILRQVDEDEVVVKRGGRRSPGRRRFVIRDGRIIGYLSVGTIELAGLFHHAVREGLGFGDLPPDLLRRRGRLGIQVRLARMRP